MTTTNPFRSPATGATRIIRASAVLAAILATLGAAAAGGIRSDDVIEASAGGFKFPDGSLQNTAAVEVRTALESVPVNINQPGSYFAAAELVMTGSGDAITVNADDVTIDLMGFSVDGAGTFSRGIVLSERHNVEIRNGTVRNFANGGIVASTGSGQRLRIINVRVVENGSTAGIQLGGSGHLVQGCTASDNGGSGFLIGNDSLLIDNVAIENNNFGIGAGFRSAVIRNVSTGNGLDGVLVSADSSVLHNTVADNGRHGISVGGGSRVRGNQVHNSGSDGIRTISSAVTVENNTVSAANVVSNALDGGGIVVGGASTVRYNHVTQATHNDIYVNGTGSVVEGNVVIGSSGSGISFEAPSGNFYAGNRASGHTTDFDAAGQTDGGDNVSF